MTGMSDVQHTRSADGTPIAWSARGTGPAVVVVNGAFARAVDSAGLVDALVAAGFRGVAWDRRSRGDSGDTRPYAPEREAEDLAAVIGAAGGDASVLGHSSGAVLALFAAAHGVPVRHLYLSEPPFRFGVDLPAADLPDRLQALVDGNDPETAVTTFQVEGIGLPAGMVEQIRASPMFDALVPLAQSTVHDAILTAAVETPTAAMCGVSAPVTILLGAETFPVLDAAARRLAEAMPAAELVEVPESRQHRPDPVATAAVVATRD